MDTTPDTSSQPHEATALAPLPVEPLLAYASASTPHHQPLGSRITTEPLPNGGVRVIDPPKLGSAARTWMIALIASSFTLLCTAGWLSEVIVDRTWSQLFFLAVPLVLLAGFTAMVAEAEIRLRRPLIIEADPGGVRLHRPTLFIARRDWPVDRIENIRVTFAMPALHSLRVEMIRNVVLTPRTRIRSRAPLSIVLIADHPSDECHWIVATLRAALKHPNVDSTLPDVVAEPAANTGSGA